MNLPKLSISKEAAVKILRDFADEIESDRWELAGVEVYDWGSLKKARLLFDLRHVES